MDIYTCYGELRKTEIEGLDYQIVIRHRLGRWAIIAIHAGGIEPGTMEIASAIAGKGHSLYRFVNAFKNMLT